MLKRYTAFLAFLIYCFILTACGAENPPTVTGTPATSSAASVSAAATSVTTTATTGVTTTAATTTTATTKPLRNGDLENQPYSEGENKGIYSGGYVDDLRHGYGEFRFDNGEVYAGYWENDRMHGEGEYIIPGFGSLHATFSDGVMDRSYVIILYADGGVYSGSITDGNLRHGWGHMEFTNGDRYEGEYEDDVRHGWGTYYFSSGDKYEGQFVDGQRTGTGSYYYKDGSVFEGDFADGKRVSGTLTFAGGDWMQGDFPGGETTGDYYYYNASEDSYRWVHYKNGKFSHWIEV